MATPTATPSAPAATFEEARADLLARRPDLFRVNSRFAPKLSYAERCAVLLFFKLGVGVPVLATAFGLNRGTVRYITRNSSRYYKEVRKEWAELGETEFYKRYWTPEGAAKVEAARDATETKLPDAMVKELKAEAATSPNRAATQKAGKHTITNLSGVTFIATVMWFDSIPEGFEQDDDAPPQTRTPGWYSVVSGKGEDPICGPASGRFTSSQALKALIATVEGTLAE